MEVTSEDIVNQIRSLAETKQLARDQLRVSILIERIFSLIGSVDVLGSLKDYIISLAQIYTSLNVKTAFSGYFVQLIFSNESWLSSKTTDKQVKVDTVDSLLSFGVKILMKHKGSDAFDKICLPFYVSLKKLHKRLSDKTSKMKESCRKIENVVEKYLKQAEKLVKSQH